jgi:hypothetical protein
MMATVMRAAASDVTEAVVPRSGHWVMDENPAATIDVTTNFLKKRRQPASGLFRKRFKGSSHRESR